MLISIVMLIILLGLGFSPRVNLGLAKRGPSYYTNLWDFPFRFVIVIVDFRRQLLRMGTSFSNVNKPLLINKQGRPLLISTIVS